VVGRAAFARAGFACRVGVNIIVIAVGRIRERPLRSVADEYLTRLRRYVRCDEVEVRSGEGLNKAVPADAWTVALEVGGEAVSSEQLARWLQRWGSQGKGRIAFLIGGPEGIPDGVSRAADVRLSLSALTLPHRLARVVLFEQLYRSMTILRGEPYAREG